MKPWLRYPDSIFILLLLGGLIFEGVACASSGATLVITGTGSSIGTMERMAKAYQKRHPHATVQVLPSIGSTGGIKAVNDDKIDIGLSYRPLKPEERSAKIIEEPYGRTAFVFGVQDSNPTRGFTLAEFEEIYAGKRSSWPDGSHIRLILRPVGDGFSAYLSGITPGLKSASEKAHAIPGVFVGNTDQEAAVQIEKTPGSLGTTSLSLIAAERRRIKALFVDGVAPSLSNVSTGRYPYAITLYLVYKRDKYAGSIKDFIEFIFSREGQRILADNGHLTMQRPTRK